MQNVKKFLSLTNLIIPNIPNLEKILSIWGSQFLPNKMREFIFKFLGNTLGIIVRIAHFVENIDRNCTFCKLKNIVSEETFLHLFWDCPTVRSLNSRFVGKYFPELINTNQDIKRFSFTSLFIHNGCEEFNLFVTTIIYCFQYLIWEYKLKKKIPSFATLDVEFWHIFEKIYYVSCRVKYSKQSVDFAICRELVVNRE